ncbi:hypothetical protein AC578_10858 [Pseudocercospora eumusae]|uniref:Vacuolar calcium ion transporter n=1 Tax=Pseudocercospora eumusae TaxID=321146 RepID=A0A139H8V2_9PEZI|nr:hypothetical protein AC578_10858 [Pseudocercospora eumusae]
MSASQIRQRCHDIARGKQTPESISSDERTALLYHVRNSGQYGRRESDEYHHYPNSQDNRPKSFLARFAPGHILSTVWAVLSNNYINLLLVAVPLGIASGAVGWPPIATFVLNFAAIIPLAALLSFATEELSEAVGPAIGGLLNATFGNAIELIVSVIALQKDQFRLVQASILGSVLVNILLVLGCCFIAGGIRNRETRYDPTVASIMSSLQTLASAALIVPTVLYWNIQRSPAGDTIDVIDVSRGTAIVLIVLYIFYLYFQLFSHSDLFNDDTDEKKDDNAASQHQEAETNNQHESKGGEILGPVGAVTCMVLTVIAVGFCAEFLVDSVDSIVEQTNMTKTFIGIILIPIISNAAEHVTAVIVSWKGKMNLALLVDLGSGMQIALFVTPLLVLIAWAMDKPLSLHFHLFETIVFFLSVLVVNFLIRGGTSNYLEGCMSVGWYIIIALAFYYYPDSQ